MYTFSREQTALLVESLSAIESILQKARHLGKYVETKDGKLAVEVLDTPLPRSAMAVSFIGGIAVGLETGAIGFKDEDTAKELLSAIKHGAKFIEQVVDPMNATAKSNKDSAGSKLGDLLMAATRPSTN